MKQLGALGAAVMIVLAMSACGDSDSDGGADVEAARPPGFEATPEYLASAVDDMESVPHRFEMAMELGVELDGEVREVGSTTISGEFDGERRHARVEGSMVGVGGGSGEEILDVPGEVLYVRSPSAAEDLEEMPEFAVTDLAAALAELGDRWGRVDLAAAADVLPEDWQHEVSQIRIQGLDPAGFARLVADAESVEELPAEEIDGESMVGLAATVTAKDFAAAQQSATSSTTTTPASSPAVEPEPESIGDIMNNIEHRAEAWIDGDGNIRRLVLTLSDVLDQIGEAAPNLEDGPNMGSIITLELSDYGDDSIRVELPDDEDTEDITAAFRSQFES